MTLDHLTSRTERERQWRLQAEQALRKGKISKAEYDFFLRKLGMAPKKQSDPSTEYAAQPTLKERRWSTSTKMVLTVLVMAMVLSFGNIMLTSLSDNSLTGYVSAPVEEITLVQGLLLDENTTVQVNVTNTTLFKLSGELRDGAATLNLLVDQQAYLVWAGQTVQSYEVYTDKESYALNGTVNVTVIPEGVSHTLWLTEDENKVLVQDSFVASEAGEFILDALINDSGNVTKVSTSFTVRNDTNASNDVVREPPTQTLQLIEECVETCELNNTGNKTLLLEVVLSEGASLLIQEIVISQPRENQAPEQVQQLPDLEIDEGESITINLDLYFNDPDGDEITYDFMNAPGVEMSVEGSVLTVTGTYASEPETMIFASDLYLLAQSNAFTITVNEVIGVTYTNTTNQTNLTTEPDHTINDTNTTINVPSNLCTHPDVNKRPVTCLQDDYQQYFRPQPLRITTASRATTAILTPIGNLRLTGEVFEGADFNARQSDYRIGFIDSYGEYHATVWFDSQSGNLYLAGSLHEENTNNVPLPGSFALTNNAGVVLAWADKYNGDLYLRGAALTNRGELE